MKKVGPFYSKLENVEDGVYRGVIGGYTVEFLYGKDVKVSFVTDDGVRGINIPCEIEIKNGDVVRIEIL